MTGESAASQRSFPVTRVYPLALLVLLVGTSVALALEANVVGVVGVIVLSILSLAYGALQTPEDIP